MRLLHTQDLHIEDFTGRVVPTYAILSHRWEEDEVSLQELRCLMEPDEGRRSVLQLLLNTPDSKQQGQGLRKIKHSCAVALKARFDWIWIDTCCIDKESSAELSEAINSMYKWYKEAAVCYAYLSDVDTSQHESKVIYMQDSKAFRDSRWFTRGWTLQELLGPQEIVFYDVSFRVIGLKADLLNELWGATGISIDCLGGRRSIYDESIATRMSWVAKRSTTRIEDIAYCLLGIFDINMPLLYGEGLGAFRRLQAEIIRNSDDETVFAHSYALSTSPKVLAHHPRNFLSPYSGHHPRIWALPSTDTPRRKIVAGLPSRFRITSIGSASYAMTNKGVKMRATYVRLTPDGLLRGLLLNCRFENQDYPVIVIIVPVKQLHAATWDVEDSILQTPNIWRIRVHTDCEDQIKKAKQIIDETLGKWHRGRRRSSDTKKDPFEYETIYLR